MSGLKGKVAIVTGGSQGIGKAIATKLADSGVNLVIADVLEEKGLETAAELAAKGVETMFVKLNVADRESAIAMVKEVTGKFDSIDFLINNAGIARDNLLMRMKPEEWDSVIAVNLTGVFNCTQAVMRTMMKKRFGRIVNIASVIGQMGNAGQSNYGATKAGVIGFTKSVAREVGSRNITVNAITPGYIDTAMTHKLSEEVREGMLKMIPLARMGTAEDIAKAVSFLVSDDASYITGAVLNVNGGMYM
jgi:3-oxoacyl-[acyl-carrier protein] reductase